MHPGHTYLYLYILIYKDYSGVESVEGVCWRSLELRSWLLLLLLLQLVIIRLCLAAMEWVLVTVDTVVLDTAEAVSDSVLLECRVDVTQACYMTAETGEVCYVWFL